jgi:hypothetical protein
LASPMNTVSNGNVLAARLTDGTHARSSATHKIFKSESDMALNHTLLRRNFQPLREIVIRDPRQCPVESVPRMRTRRRHDPPSHALTERTLHPALYRRLCEPMSVASFAPARVTPRKRGVMLCMSYPEASHASGVHARTADMTRSLRFRWRTCPDAALIGINAPRASD